VGPDIVATKYPPGIRDRFLDPSPTLDIKGILGSLIAGLILQVAPMRAVAFPAHPLIMLASHPIGDQQLLAKLGQDVQSSTSPGRQGTVFVAEVKNITDDEER
jgi:hypothetical protein